MGADPPLSPLPLVLFHAADYSLVAADDVDLVVVEDEEEAEEEEEEGEDERRVWGNDVNKKFDPHEFCNFLKTVKNVKKKSPMCDKKSRPP